jgi:hypothetical protein
MEFRWIAFIALWTLLSGPVFDMPNHRSGPSAENSVAAHGQTTPPTETAR